MIDANLEKFISYFEPKQAQVMNFAIKQGLIKKLTVRNYCLVMDLKELQFVKNYSYAKSIQVIAKKYCITTRRVSVIYKNNMRFIKPPV